MEGQIIHDEFLECILHSFFFKIHHWYDYITKYSTEIIPIPDTCMQTIVL